MQEIQNIIYLDDLQKVQLLFVFSRPMTDCFHARLLKEGHEVELNKRRHIVLFRSKDGKYRRSVEEFIQGEPSLDAQDTQGQSPSDQDLQNGGVSSSGAHSLPRISASANDSVSPLDLPPDGPSSSGAHGFPADDSATEQKPIVFGGPGTPNFPVVAYNSVKKEPMRYFENEQNRFVPSSSRDFLEECFDGPMAPGSRDLHKQRVRNNSVRSPVEKEILLSRQQREMAENYVADNYSHDLIEQQRRNIETQFADQHIPAEVYEEFETPRITATSPARIETSGTKRRQESELAQVKRSKPSGCHTENRGSARLSISSSSEDDCIIIEPQFVSFTTIPSSISAPEDSRVGESSHDQEPAPISALKLAEQIETITHFLSLHDLQTKTARIVQELQIENKTICQKKFHREILSVWASVDDAKVKNHVGESLNAKRFLESLRLCVIRPLGRKLVANSLAYIEKKIKKLEDKKSQKVLPMVKIKENLESLLELATNN